MIAAEVIELETLEQEQWQALAAQHHARLSPIVEAYRDRRARAVTHPVHDFLFTYYQTNRGTLLRWRPSARMALRGEAAEAFLEDARYRRVGQGVCLNPGQLDDKTRQRIQWVRSLLRAAMNRPPRFNCFGLHEWAMVYKAEEVRHESTPLRVSRGDLERIVESSSIRCSHFDAFRFFTPSARPLNEMQPGRDEREKNEQFGCVHFNMDLYRWSIKLSPWVGSELIRDCFELALRARELDMRASPYDLVEYGYQPIRIETAEGREAYAKEQGALYLAGQPLAERLLEECDILLSARA